MNGQKFEHFFEFITSSGAQLRGEGGGGGLPCPVLKIVKKCPDFGKKALIVSLLGLNLPFKM